MNFKQSEQERQWAAEKRDFVADARDDVAAERDTLGDEREREADARESALDARERALDARAADLGLPPPTTQEAAHRAEDVAERQHAQRARADRAADRTTATDARDAAAKRRLDANPTLSWPRRSPPSPESLYAADSYDAVLLRIAQTAVGTVAGCDMASINQIIGSPPVAQVRGRRRHPCRPAPGP